MLEGVLDLDRTAHVPLSQQLYRSIREAVRQGHLAAGAKLPSSRKLAHDFGLSRNTVNAAYDLLKAEQIVDVRPGAAPTVREALPLIGKTEIQSTATVERQLSERGKRLTENLRGDSWAMRHGALHSGEPALDGFPYELWARALRRAARSLQNADLLYQNTAGLPQLKEVLADYLSTERGVRAEPEQVVIASSTQAATSALASLLADQGDAAWVEDPGYLGARTAFHGAGLTMTGMPVDLDGGSFEGLDTRNVRPKLIYVTPSHQYPLGMRMPLSRRLALIKIAGEMGATILEDDYDSEFLFEGRPIAALQGLSENGEVIYLGTFSKSLLPGLRVSYAVVPADLVDPFSSLLRNTGRLANVHAQKALADFIEAGHYRAHLKNIRALYQKRGNALVAALKSSLGNSVEVDYPTGNVQISLCFNDDVDDRVIARAMQARGYAVSPLSTCYLEEAPRPGLIMGFAGASERQIEGGVAALNEIMHSH